MTGGNCETKDALAVKELTAGKLGVGAITTPIISTNSMSATNWTTISTINCDAASNDELSDMVGFILKTLQEYGLIQGTVTA